MSWIDRFRNTTCRQRDRLVTLLVVLSLMGVLLAVSFPFLEPGTTAYAMALLDLIVFVVTFVLVAGTYWYCSKWAMDSGPLSGNREA